MTDELDRIRREIHMLRQEVHLVSKLGTRRAAVTLTAPGRPVDTARLAQPAAAALTGRSWRTMSTAQASEAWNALTDFVDWVVDRYQLSDTLPSCWYQHGAMVEELHALQIAWTGAYRRSGAAPIEPLQWHDQLHRTLARLREWDRYGCAAGTHRDHAPEPTDEAALKERDEFIQADNLDRAARDGHVPIPTAPD